MKLFRQLLLPMAALMMILSSCSKESELLQTIPSRVQNVARVNVNKLAADLGIKVVDGKVVIPEGIHYGPELSADKLRLLGRAASALDLEHLMLFTADNHALLTASVLQPDSLDIILADAGCDKQQKSGYTVFVDNGFCVARRDNQVWFVDASVETAVERIDKVLKDASEESVADLDGVAKTLGGSEPVIALFNVGKFNPNAGGDTWYSFTAAVKDNAIQGTVKSMNSDGSPVTVKGFARINTPVLQYVPQNACLVTAFGLTKEIDWDSAMSMVSTAMGPMQKAQFEMLLPYLKALDGTCMVAIGPADGLDVQQAMQTGDIDFIAMFHMDQDMINEAIGQATTFASQYGTVESAGEGLYRIPFNGKEYYVGNVDGCLTIASHKPTDNNGTAIAGEFTGKKSAFTLKLPSARLFHPDADFGIDLLMTGNDDKAVYTFRLTGTDAPILPTILSL